MAYLITFDKFKTLIKNKELKTIISKLKLPDASFFSEPQYKTGKNVKINIAAKTSKNNIHYIEKELKIKQVGLNLDFSVEDETIRFIESSKKSSSANASGKLLADAGELATVMSLIKDIKTPQDTGEKLFIEDTDSFIRWLPTFQLTKVAVKTIIGSLNSFNILHDATDNSQFKKVIDSFSKKIGIPKDSWNPADLFIIRKNKMNNIIKELNTIVENFSVKEGLIDMFNNKIYEMYKNKDLYPISLKQITSKKAKIEYTNEPNKVKVAYYVIIIKNININLSTKGKEIGLFTFENTDTGKTISLQVRGFPHSYNIAQTEITSDGTLTGGRLGKVSASIIDRILEEYNFKRIKSISYFGTKPKYFSMLDIKRINEVYSQYTKIIHHTKIKNQNRISKEEFTELIEKAKTDYDLAATLCQKIQGIRMAYFFTQNDKNISYIMNKMINGAKKISADNGFFIKIY